MATSTIGTGGDYATLDLWQTDRLAIGIGGEHEVARLLPAGSHLSSAFTLVDGWHGPITIEPEPGNEHSGTAGSGIVINPNASGAHVFLIQEDTQSVNIQGFEITNPGAGTSDEAIRIDPAANGGSSVYAIRSMLIYNLTASACDGIYNFRRSPEIVIENCAFWNIQRACVHAQQFENATGYTGDWTIRNCTFLQYVSGQIVGLIGVGLQNAGSGSGSQLTCRIFNSIFKSNHALAGRRGVAASGTSDNLSITLQVTGCISDDDSWDELNASAFFTFTESNCLDIDDGVVWAEDTASPAVIVADLDSPYDLHLVDHANNIAIDHCNGSDAPSSGEDWEGDARATTGTANVDAGADEIAAAGGPTLTPVVAAFAVPTISIAAPAVVTLTPAVATLAAPPVALAAPALVSLAPAAATFAVPAPSLSVGATVTLTPAAAVLAVPAPSLEAPAIVTIDPAVATFAAPPVALDVRATVALTPAVATFAAPAVTLGTGGLTLAPAAALFVVPPVSIAAPAVVTLTPAIGLLQVPEVEIAAPAIVVATPAVATFAVPAVEVAAGNVRLEPALARFVVPPITLAAPAMVVLTPAVATFVVPAVGSGAPALVATFARLLEQQLSVSLVEPSRSVRLRESPVRARLL